MDVKTALQAMISLRDALIKDETLSKQKIRNSEEFVHMCQLIPSGIRSLPINDLVAVLHTLLLLNVSVHSSLVQSLLQLVRVQVNDLSVGQIMLLYNVLKEYSSTTENKVPLTESICIALPKVFQQRAQFELNDQSYNLIQALKFSCIIHDTETKLYIINILCRHDIKPKDMKDVFRALCTLRKWNPVSSRLLFKVKNKIRTNCQYLEFMEIQSLLSLVSNKVVKGNIEFYSEEMVDALCNAVLNNNTTFMECTLILKYLNKMRHGNVDLLDYLSSILLKNRSVLDQCTTSSIDHFMKSLIIANYKPPNWESIQTLLLDFVKSYDYPLSDAASVAFRLLSLDCYCPELIEKVFVIYETHYLKVTNKYTMLNVLKLYWCIRLLYPEYTGPMINETILDKTYTYNMRNRDPSFLESLERAVGDAKYIKSDLKTKSGELIDHVIVIQPNGLPLDIRNYKDIKCVDELAVPSECSKILLFLFPRMAYCINKGNILSTVLLPLKAIETMKGYYVILINPYLWETLSYGEKISYLQRAIQSKCNIANIPQG
ncbi:uncharacterized protein LOC100875267 isoform X2 [Megachile rotundata]|nr:PREDICTED: uncharacterized protein LOC100875267 isoform X2 [Megachile rotundata]